MVCGACEPPSFRNSCLRSLTLGKHQIVMTTTITHEVTMTSMMGGCLCGRVRYTITAAPLRSGICHCRNCRRYTGSAFEPFMMFPAASVNLQGELKSFDLAGDSGRIVHRRFCPNCGSGVVNEGEGDAGIMIVLVGSQDDQTVFKPTFEVMCETAQSWVHNGSKDRRRFP